MDERLKEIQELEGYGGGLIMESESHRKIKEFIKKRGYTYSVTDILNGYIKRLDGYYNSYTMNDCLDNLERECEEATQEINNIIENHSELFQ